MLLLIFPHEPASAKFKNKRKPFLIDHVKNVDFDLNSHRFLVSKSLKKYEILFRENDRLIVTKLSMTPPISFCD